MKHWTRIIVAALLLVVVAGCAAGGEQPSVHPNANQVLFVGGGGSDPFTIARLKKLGMEVTVKNDNEVKTEDAEGKGLIFISYTSTAGRVGGKFLNLDIPMIFTAADMAVPHGLVKNADQTGSFVHENGVTSIDIVHDAHPITEGFKKGNMEVYKKKSNTIYGVPGEEATVLATAAGDLSKATLFAYDKGVKNANGEQTKARMVFYYVFHQAENNVNEDGWKLFDQMVEWAVGKR